MSVEKPVAVIKVGGALLSDDVSIASLWEAIRDLTETASVVVVHGGGPQSTEMARRLGHEPRIVEGRRVTTDLDLDILLWTVRGDLNTRLVAAAGARGVRAVGVSGVDGRTVQVVRRPPWRLHGEDVDFGWVGDVRAVDPALLVALLKVGFVPVVAPVATDDAGLRYNVNADTVAQAVAVALRAQRFLLVTESGGVRRDPVRAESTLMTIDASTFDAGAAQGWIAGGMLVKLRVAFNALAAGIDEVYVVPIEGVRENATGTRVVR